MNDKVKPTLISTKEYETPEANMHLYRVVPINKTIYLAGPITGLDLEKATQWRDSVVAELRPLGYRVINPMEGEYDTLSHNSEVLEDRAKEIIHTDKYYVDQSDILFINFTYTGEELSVGTISELSWAWADHKIIIVVMPEDSPYNKPWLNVMYTYKFNNFTDAMSKLKEIQ